VCVRERESARERYCVSLYEWQSVGVYMRETYSQTKRGKVRKIKQKKESLKYVNTFLTSSIKICFYRKTQKYIPTWHSKGQVHNCSKNKRENVI